MSGTPNLDDKNWHANRGCLVSTMQRARLTWRPPCSLASVRGALETAMSGVSKEILQWAGDSGDESGCTAVTAVAVDDSYLVAHVGDSRALLCQQEPGRGTHAFQMLRLGPCTMNCLSGEAHVGPSRCSRPCWKEALCLWRGV